nr:MFS-type transporter clz9-like [Parasteatoda tepidariorum]
MTGLLFLKVLKHIKKHTLCLAENKILLVMDNRGSHCTLDAVLFAKDIGIVLVTLPPHCSHHLQPLDVGVIGPFKSKLRVAQNDWMLLNSGKTISVHNLAAIANTAYTLTCTNKNITAGFRKTGIWPFSRSILTDEDFEPSSVTVSQAYSSEILSADQIVEERCKIDSLPSTSKKNHKFCTPTRLTESKPNEPRLMTPVDVP